MGKNIFTVLLALLITVAFAQERPPFSDRVVNYGDPNELVWTQFMPYVKGRIMEGSEPFISYGRSPLLPSSNYAKMLENINNITALLRSVPCVGAPQGVDIHISKAIGHNYDTDTYSDYKQDPNALLYGEITLLVDPCIFYKGKRGNAEEMFAKLIIRINNFQIGYPEDQDAKPAQVKINPEKVATFHDGDVYWLEDNVEYAVIVKNKIPVFAPISQEDYWKACIKRQTNLAGGGFLVDIYKEKLAKLSDRRRQQQAVVNMEYEDFTEMGAAEQPKYFISNPQLIDRSRRDEIQLITISWSNITRDTPLRLYKGGKEGFDIRYYILKQLHDDSRVWSEIISL